MIRVRIIHGTLQFGKMRQRKVKSELESYHVANKSESWQCFKLKYFLTVSQFSKLGSRKDLQRS